MRFNSISLPAPGAGKSFVGQVSMTVPDQSMSLQEIIRRFTRGEAVPIGQPVAFDSEADSHDVDLEKLRHMDLVDREEYVQTLQEVQKKYQAQEERKKYEEVRRKADADKMAEAKRVRIAAAKLAKSKTRPKN